MPIFICMIQGFSCSTSDKIRIFSPEKFFCYAQPTGLILVSFSKSFDILLTSAFFSGTLFHNKAALLNESHHIALFFAPQLHQTVLPPFTHDKIFWCCGAFFFSRDLRPGKRFAILHTHLDNRISRPDWIQRHDLAELRASLTTPLQNRGRNLIRGERRTTTDTSIHIHTPMPGFENLYPLLNLNFQNLRKK